ncbi:CHAT domain-containing protein [Streptomyces sparsogenes]|uniref:CHAT domain-containing protein n=1 Tax=Streptomyces sparsogenes TaxID=67365 RepID=UPI00331A3D47
MSRPDPEADYQAGQQHYQRFALRQSASDGEAARHRLEAALEGVRGARHTPIWLGHALAMCGDLHARRWQGAQDRESLRRALDLLDRFADHPTGQPDIDIGGFQRLGVLLRDRAQLDGAEQDLTRAAEALHRAVELARSSSHGGLPSLLLSLVMTRWDSYRRSADPEVLAPLEAEVAECLEIVDGRSPERLGLVQLRGLVRSELIRLGRLPDSQEARTFSDEARQAAIETPAMLRERGIATDAFLTGASPWAEAAYGVEGLREEWLKAKQRLEEGAEPGSEEHRQGAALLATFQPFVDPAGDGFLTPDAAASLLSAAEGAAGADDATSATSHALRALLVLAASGGADRSRLEEAEEALDRAERACTEATSGGIRRSIEIARAVLTTARGQERGSIEEMEQAARAMAVLADRPEATDYERTLHSGAAAVASAMSAYRSRDEHALAAAVETLSAVVEKLPPDDIAHKDLAHNLRVARMQLDALRGGDALSRLAEEELVEPDFDDPALQAFPPGQRAHGLSIELTEWVVRAAGRGDVDALRRGIDAWHKVIELAGPEDPLLASYTMQLGNAYGLLGTVRRSRRDLGRAIGYLQEAARLSGGPGQRVWTLATAQRAHALRQRALPFSDDLAQARRLGLDALRGHAWDVLLQTGTAHASALAEEARRTARDIVAWCLADGAAEQAVTALEGRRGLVLHAATTHRGVPDLLEQAGQPELAALWRRARAAYQADGAMRPAPTSDVPSPTELRHRALEALRPAQRDAAVRFLDPPTPDDIVAALRHSGTDALVYLVPADEETPGCAVLVTTWGGPEILPLPRLTESADELLAYTAAARRADDRGLRPRDAMPDDEEQRPDSGNTGEGALEALCSWAWQVAMGPLLGRLCARRPTPRLVLVPLGELALVPWHAARTRHYGGGFRHAVQRAAISYTASARLFCDVWARDAVPLHSGGALVVGNPTGDLSGAGQEAAALHAACYPNGLYLGQGSVSAGGSGTAGQVVAWLNRYADSGAGVVHLACHGEVHSHGYGGAAATSRLSLADGPLAAETLIGRVRGRGGTARIGLVVLAACTTHVSGYGHDEAFSLSTAFLVAGARSVIGSLWRVPDSSTSVLMFMTHHYLRQGAAGPGEALRMAQLWMLDPGREVPATMPSPLRERSQDLGAGDIIAWAGFTHLGQ